LQLSQASDERLSHIRWLFIRRGRGPLILLSSAAKRMFMPIGGRLQIFYASRMGINA
jgi:hypothetical protein